MGSWTKLGRFLRVFLLTFVSTAGSTGFCYRTFKLTDTFPKYIDMAGVL